MTIDVLTIITYTNVIFNAVHIYYILYI